MQIQNFKDIESYINSFDEATKVVLKSLRNCIEKAVPEAVAGISYGMPAYKFDGKPLAYFAANKNHTGFYPTPSPIVAFEKALAGYKTSKGAVQFPHDKKLPLTLISKMVVFRKNQIAGKNQ